MTIDRGVNSELKPTVLPSGDVQINLNGLQFSC